MSSGSEERPRRDPLTELDDTLAGVAAALGAEAPDSLTSALSESERAALRNVLALVAAIRVTHTLNTSGDVLVPIDDGAYMIVISPIVLAGEEWLSLRVFLRVEVPDDATAHGQVAAFCTDTSLTTDQSACRWRGRFSSSTTYPRPVCDRRCSCA